jgi:hypothetical protein
MKLTATVAMAIWGTAVGAGQPVRHGSMVTVCLGQFGNTMVRAQATAIASKMYEAIGVTIDWRSGGRACNAEGVIHIGLTDDTPAKLMPGALAYALPYEGINIRVFVDRVLNIVGERTLPYLLAHVLVHEIGHILEGINRHSRSGVMTAHWTSKDYRVMEMGCLPFAEEDVTLIHQGLQNRSERLLAKN